MMTGLDTILCGDALATLRTLPDGIAHTCVTSPPYYSLRDYGVPGQMGLESTIEEYVAKLVEVFREVRRVLRPDGTLWLNLGDCYSTGVGANLRDCLHTGIKGSTLFIGGRCTLTVTAKGEEVLTTNKSAPDGEFTRLLGVQRVSIKERDDNFSEILNLLHSECDVWVSRSVRFMCGDAADSEVVLDVSQGLSIVITDGNSDLHTALDVAVKTQPTKRAQRSLAVKESTEPVAEAVGDIQSAGYALSLDSSSKRFTKIDSVHESVSFSDASMSRSNGLGDFRVTVASEEQLAFALCNGRVDLTVRCVRHLFVSNRFGSLIHYKELYDQAQRKARSLRAKQEMGVPEMVKRALMEDGWICRCTIIWHKPNPMPESVLDRPTRAHEYIFLLSASSRYYYDAAAIREPLAAKTYTTFGIKHRAQGNDDLGKVKSDNWGHTVGERQPKVWTSPAGWDTSTGDGGHGTIHRSGRTEKPDKQRGHSRKHAGFNARWDAMSKEQQQSYGANRRDVWVVAPEPWKGRHFATFPQRLIEPCILAGCPSGGIVLDPFFGRGTVGRVARRHSRHYIGIELNPGYVEMAEAFIAEERQPVLWTA